MFRSTAADMADDHGGGHGDDGEGVTVTARVAGLEPDGLVAAATVERLVKA